MKKEIIGYELKPEFEEMRTSITAIIGFSGWNFETVEQALSKDEYSFKSHRRFLGLMGVLDLWLNPIYKEIEPEYDIELIFPKYVNMSNVSSDGRTINKKDSSIDEIGTIENVTIVNKLRPRIEKLIEEIPNDQQLGKKIREMF